MNNRIDELAIQAGAKIETAHWVYYDDFSYQKFAELIVKECIDLVEGYTKQRTHTTFYKAEEQIKQHFGVEE